MDLERHLISAAVASREHFDSLVSREVEPELSPSGQVVFENLHKYYTEDPSAKRCDVELLGRYIKQAQPNHAEALVAVLHGLPDTSNENVIALWLDHKRGFIRKRLAQAAVATPYDEATTLEWIEKLDFYRKYNQDDAPKVYQGVPVSELLIAEKEVGRILIGPQIINDALRGGVPRGKHIGLIARPEYGKTQFAINTCAINAKRGSTILYCPNEEGPRDILLRFTSRLCDVDSYAVEDNPNQYTEQAKQRGYDNVIVNPMWPGSVRDITKMVEKYKPDILVVDQLRNLYIKGTQSITEVLERGGRAMRNIGLRHGTTVFSIAQSGESAHNKPIVDYNDTEYSNTGFAATCDLFICIGSDEELRLQNRAMVTLSRNKISGRQESFIVEVNKLRSKIKSIGSV